MAIVKEESKSFPLWFQNDTINANYFSEVTRCLKNLPISSQSTSLSQIATISTGGNKWLGGALAENGIIYCAPWSASTILKINTNNDSITEIGSFVGSLKYAGGLLANNGKIYFIPSSASEVLVIEPNNSDNTYTFGLGTFTAGTLNWLGGCLDKTGRYIYAAGYHSTKVLKIDTQTDTVTEIGSLGVSGNKWGSGSLGINGHLYFAPLNETTVLKIDTSTDTISNIGSLGASPSKYPAAVTSKEGNVYLVPNGVGTWGKIAVATDTVTTFAASAVSNGACLGVDGKIYVVNGTMVVLNTTGDTQITFSAANIDTSTTILLAENGKMYTIPRSLNYVGVIGDEVDTNKNFPLSRIFNKY